MPKILLFIREPGGDDIIDVHSSHEAARKALATYVRRRTTGTRHAVPIDDATAIKAYFARPDAMYAMAALSPPRGGGGKR